MKTVKCKVTFSEDHINTQETNFFSLSPLSVKLVPYHGKYYERQDHRNNRYSKKDQLKVPLDFMVFVNGSRFLYFKGVFFLKNNNKSTITISLWLYFTTTTKILQFFMGQSIWKIWGHKTLRYLTLIQELEGGFRSKNVASITAMIIFRIILHPAVHIFDFHIFITLDPNSSRVSSVSWPRNIKMYFFRFFFSRHCFKIFMIKKGVQNLPIHTPIPLRLHKSQRQLFPIINNYSPSPNGLWVNSPWGRRPNGLLTHRPWGREE